MYQVLAAIALEVYPGGGGGRNFRVGTGFVNLCRSIHSEGPDGAPLKGRPGDVQVVV